MFCDICTHKSEIDLALAPCQTCEHANAAGQQGPCGSAACKGCPFMVEIQTAMRPCLSCEAGKLHGEVHIDANEAAHLALQYAKPTEHTADSGVTKLDPEVEDALRKVLFVLFDFSPIELLLIQHVMHGRNVGTFREPLAKLKDRLNSKYDLTERSRSFRAVAHEWKKGIERKCPPLAELFAAVSDANAGGSRHR